MKVAVEHWGPDNSWTVRWGNGITDAFYGFKEEAVAQIAAQAFRRGYQIAKEERPLYRSNDGGKSWSRVLE